MQCTQGLELYMSAALSLLGASIVMRMKTTPSNYGKHINSRKKQHTYVLVPAKCGWFLQELPSFLVPFLLVLSSPHPGSPGCLILLLTFCAHYFHRRSKYTSVKLLGA